MKMKYRENFTAYLVSVVRWKITRFLPINTIKYIHTFPRATFLNSCTIFETSNEVLFGYILTKQGTCDYNLLGYCAEYYTNL